MLHSTNRVNARGFHSSELALDKTRKQFDANLIAVKCESHMLDFNLYATRNSFEIGRLTLPVDVRTSTCRT